MEPWLKLLLQWAIPVFKTLVYLKTTNQFSGIPLNEKPISKPKPITIPDQGVDQPPQGEKVVAMGQHFANKLPDVINAIAQTLDEKDHQEQQRFQQQKVLQQQLVAEHRQTLFKLAAYQRETTLQLPEVHKILDHWPLRLFPSQLLEPHRPNRPIPLRIFIAPPQVQFERFGEITSQVPDIELGLAQRLREFLSHHYPLHSQVRPTEFLGGAWESKRFHSESSIKALFSLLKSEPTLILESEIDGDFLIFRLAYWGLGQESYCYSTLCKLSYRDFIYESAKARALKWKNTRDKLLALGKSLEDINAKGGDNAINLAYLEEAEELQQAGIDTHELIFPYKVNRKDWDNFCQFLSTCHCLVAGWVSDIHHLVHSDVPPLLPELLPPLIAEVSDPDLVQVVMQTTLSIYQEVLQSLISERPYWEPELSLKLAQSLTCLPDKSWATIQIKSSLKAWLQQRQQPHREGLQAFEAMRLVLTQQDYNYCQMLQSCLAAVGDEQGANQVQDLLEVIASRQQSQTFANLGLTSTFTGLSGKVRAIAIHPHGQTLLSCGGDSTIKIWDIISLNSTPIQKLNGHSGGVLTLTLSHDGQILASSDQSKNRSYIKVWNLHQGKLLWTLSGHRKQIHSLAISPDNHTLASGSHKIKLWNLNTGEPFRTLFGHKEWVYSLAISPDGQTLVSGSGDKTVKIWKLATGQLLRTLSGHKASVRAVAISPDGQTIVSGSEDKTIKLWDFETGKLLATLTDHTGAVYAIALSLDGEYLISGSEDKTIKVWHLHRGELMQTLEDHTAPVYALAIGGDGLLASGSEDQTIKLWRPL